MHRRQKLFATVMVLLAAGVLAAELPDLIGEAVSPIEVTPVVAEETGAAQTGTAMSPAPRPESEMMGEMREVLETEKATLASLGVQLEQAADHEAALETQRQAERTKQDTELQLLRIQADYARQEGREEQAAEIESAIERILNPPSRPNPVSRPEPRREDIDGASTQN